MNYIKGYKTYIVATLMVLVALVNLISGDATLLDSLNSPYLLVLLEGLGLGALRHGIK